jgi:hypothetical protein
MILICLISFLHLYLVEALVVHSMAAPPQPILHHLMTGLHTSHSFWVPTLYRIVGRCLSPHKNLHLTLLVVLFFLLPKLSQLRYTLPFQVESCTHCLPTNVATQAIIMILSGTPTVSAHKQLVLPVVILLRLYLRVPHLLLRTLLLLIR